MARRKEKTPFEKVIEARGTLELYVQYGDVALRNRSIGEFAADLLEAMNYLMTVRNMVRSIVALDEAPEEAVSMYLPATAE